MPHPELQPRPLASELGDVPHICMNSVCYMY
uniref:Uncharacterized protein n=1 Tax=Arundo donax TaxID=35708 RepID=A0A0A9A4N2_ARUDO